MKTMQTVIKLMLNQGMTTITTTRHVTGLLKHSLKWYCYNRMNALVDFMGFSISFGEPHLIHGQNVPPTNMAPGPVQKKVEELDAAA